jgi:hypothetical protein
MAHPQQRIHLRETRMTRTSSRSCPGLYRVLRHRHQKTADFDIGALDPRESDQIRVSVKDRGNWWSCDWW